MILRNSVWKEQLHASAALYVYVVYVFSLQERVVIEMHDKLQRGPPLLIHLGYLCISQNTTVRLSLLLLWER